MSADTLTGETGLTQPPWPVAILLVDDNPAKRLALRAVLLPLGHAIVEADSGRAALRRLMTQDFAVILLDVAMPDMNGFETAALIRKRRQSEMTPIIFITAYASGEIEATDRYVAGAVDFMFAPVPPTELRAKVSVFASQFTRAEALARQAHEVQTSADQLRLVTEAAPIGMFQTDVRNRYVYTNPMWTEITGISAQDARGRHWATILDTDQRGSLAAEWPDGAGEPAELCHRFELRPSEPDRRVVLVTAKAVPDTDGGAAGWVGTLADITAETGAEAAMSAARDKATEASRLKSDFLANMSHEIRTPMNGVIGMTDLLLETDLDGRQRDYAQTVRNSGEALLTIINDILDFSKVEAGKVDIEHVEFGVETVVDGVVDLLAGSAQAKGLEVLVTLDRSVPGVVCGDPGRLRQVLTNLLGNAIKFTAVGEITVSVNSVADAGGDTDLRFEVGDSGVGIAPGKLTTIFHPFIQADTSTTRRYGGTGLGLAISSALVALMGGSCGVSSRPGSGSTFWFTIRVAAARGQPPRPLRALDPDLEGVTALVVDDHAGARDVLHRCLTDWGMTVSTADSGPTGLALLRTAEAEGRPFAVALVDRHMPGMDGVQVRAALARDPAQVTRLVLLTAMADRGAGGTATDDCAFTPKPIRREPLRTCLRQALGLPAATTPAPVARTVHPDGEHAGRLLLAEDNLINQKVAVAMLSRAGYQVDTVLTGTEAVQAAATQPYDAILMDCQMPELNGYEATAAIRALEGPGRRTPIIAMTAGARREDQERCLAEGMDSYLAKPVSKDALLALVAQSVRDSRRRQARPGASGA